MAKATPVNADYYDLVITKYDAVNGIDVVMAPATVFDFLGSDPDTEFQELVDLLTQAFDGTDWRIKVASARMKAEFTPTP
jgi:hypothetical protein